VKGGKSPLTWSAFDLPDGLSLGAKTGRISGQPSKTGKFPVQVLVRDSAKTTPDFGSVAFKLTVSK
jgi:hypothetical protein